MCEEKVAEIVENLDVFHKTYYAADTFRGPCLHFHHRALECRNSLDTFAEASYAMLTAWGMHRMGPKGPKLKCFDVYKESLNLLWPAMQEASTFNHQNLNDDQWSHIKTIFCGLDVMASGTSLVGNSKVMAHALPHLIPPIDRTYTLGYLYGKGTIRNDIDTQWERLHQIVTTFFYPVLASDAFCRACEKWNTQDYPWDTSPLKITDNLIIGAKRYPAKH